MTFDIGSGRFENMLSNLVGPSPFPMPSSVRYIKVRRNALAYILAYLDILVVLLVFPCLFMQNEKILMVLVPISRVWYELKSLIFFVLNENKQGITNNTTKMFVCSCNTPSLNGLGSYHTRRKPRYELKQLIFLVLHENKQGVTNLSLSRHEFS